MCRIIFSSGNQRISFSAFSILCECNVCLDLFRLNNPMLDFFPNKETDLSRHEIHYFSRIPGCFAMNILLALTRKKSCYMIPKMEVLTISPLAIGEIPTLTNVVTDIWDARKCHPN